MRMDGGRVGCRRVDGDDDVVVGRAVDGGRVELERALMTPRAGVDGDAVVGRLVRAVDAVAGEVGVAVASSVEADDGAFAVAR